MNYFEEQKILKMLAWLDEGNEVRVNEKVMKIISTIEETVPHDPKKTILQNFYFIILGAIMRSSEKIIVIKYWTS